MNIEQIEERYVKGYDFADEKDVIQWKNDMEWLLDEVLRLKGKYKNLLRAINRAMDENNKYDY